MSNKVCFIGHREYLPMDINEKLYSAVQKEINLGCKFFTMGTHGKFDLTSLRVCKKLRQVYKDIKIEVVITSLRQIDFAYKDVETIMYDIEDAYFKQKITLSNKYMIDNCDTLICYVIPNEYRSGAKAAMNYAKRKGLKIINLYNNKDFL